MIIMRVTGTNTYGVQGGAKSAQRRSEHTASYSDFFKTDSFTRTKSAPVQINNYYTKNMKKSNAPYPSSNCYVEDVEGAKAALEKLKAEADSFDYTGMSDGEIFVSIFERYADYFGEDFVNIHWQQFFIYTHELPRDNVNTAHKIHTQFYSEVYNQVNSMNEAHKYFYGYDGMSNEEMKAAIYGEFVLSGGTYSAFYKMAIKLYETGLITSEELHALDSTIELSQLQKNELPISVLFYEKYSNLLHGYYMEMDLDEIFKILDKSLLTKTYHGLNSEMRKAADNQARDILNELRELMKGNQQAI